ncbi:serine/threonine-protein kinase 3 [Pelomyxa schiedti]|nr:serine/threonine-protein kinase 3 [Pelomyxa schiedti]
MSGPDIQPSSSLSASLSPPSTLPSLSTAAAAATQSLSLARVSPKEDSTARWARELISSQQQLYELGNEIGRGAYGIVFSGVCLQTREPVAIKLIEGCCENENESRRYIREIKIMKYFAHSTHVLGLIDIFPLSEGNQKFAHIGLVSELMDCDLRTLIYDRGPISSEQCRIIMYGILCGAHEIHSACIVHRDLRPKNILIKGNRVKICDFGLARGQSHRMSLLSNLSHQWYTAPEGLFNNNCYTTAVDVWSLGCIFAEMLTNQILFKGESRLVRQVEKIFQVLGTPNEETINRICGKHERWLAQIQELPLYPVTPLETHFPSAPPDGIHLLQMMLVVNPAERITTTAALSHPYFTGVANLATDEKPLKPAPVDVPSIATSPKILKDMLYQECHTVGPTRPVHHNLLISKKFPCTEEALRQWEQHAEFLAPLVALTRSGPCVADPRGDGKRGGSTGACGRPPADQIAFAPVPFLVTNYASPDLPDRCAMWHQHTEATTARLDSRLRRGHNSGGAATAAAAAATTTTTTSPSSANTASSSGSSSAPSSPASNPLPTSPRMSYNSSAFCTSPRVKPHQTRACTVGDLQMMVMGGGGSGRPPATTRGGGGDKETSSGSQSRSPSPDASPSPPLLPVDPSSPVRSPSSKSPPRDREHGRSPHRRGKASAAQSQVQAQGEMGRPSGFMPVCLNFTPDGNPQVMINGGMGVMERPTKHLHHHHHRHHTTTRHTPSTIIDENGGYSNTHPRRRSCSYAIPLSLSPSMFANQDRATPTQNQTILPPYLALASTSRDKHSGSKSMRAKTGSSKRASVGHDVFPLADDDSTYHFELGDPERTLNIMERLGEGSFGSVWKAQHDSGKLLAIKKVPADQDEHIISKEVSSMKDLWNSYIVRYWACCNVKAELWIVMDYCNGGSLQEIMKTCGRTLFENEIASATCHVLKGLNFLHSVNKLHRHIKASNILVDANGIAKLADWECLGNAKQQASMIGTPYWMAPEFIQDVGCDSRADIWSLGITCIELAEGAPPHWEVNPIRALLQIPQWDPPTLTQPEKWSSSFSRFLSRCLVKRPDQRPLSSELLQEPFIKPVERTTLIELVQYQEQMRSLQPPEKTQPPSKEAGPASSSLPGDKGSGVPSTPVSDTSDADFDMSGLSGIWSKFVTDNPTLVGDAEGDEDDEGEDGDEAEDGGTTTEGQNSDLQTPRHSSCLEPQPNLTSFVPTPGSTGVTPLKPTFIDFRTGIASHSTPATATTAGNGTACNTCDDLKHENNLLRAEIDKVNKLNSQLSQRLEETEEEVNTAKSDADRIRSEFQNCKKWGNAALRL